MDRRDRPSSRLRRWLLSGPLLTGGLGLLGLFRQAAAAPWIAEPVRQADDGGTSTPTPAPAEAAPLFRPGILVTPALVTTTPPDIWFEVGRSIRDAPIRALRLGSGSVRLALMGSIHGGWERNTERLTLALFEHLRDTPGAIPSSLSVYVVPTTNPDGLAAGNGPDAAWNARGVDLNRNFDTANWSPDTFGRPGGRYGPTGTRAGAGGTAPFSEPETRAIRDFVLGQRIDAVVSYHSGIVSVTGRDGGGGIAEPFARQMAVDTGYPYIAVWTEYRLTGQFMDWLDAVGVKGVEIDLPDQQGIDRERNLKAVTSVMAMLTVI